MGPIGRLLDKPPPFVTRVAFGPFFGKTTGKFLFPVLTRRHADDMVFINWGYEEDPPMGLPLSAADEPDRYCIQLYHRTAAQVDLTGKNVLEISCGHGGGASYLMRALHPASYIGLDLNQAGIEFCRHKHKLPGLEFVRGDAENLPFADQSFDAVINIEASHLYPRFDRFLTEVARVLRPGGHFLYADLRPRTDIADWEAALADAPMRLVSQTDISTEVVRGNEKVIAKYHGSHVRGRRRPAFLQGLTARATRAYLTWLHRIVLSGEYSYRVYCFAKD